MNENNNLPQNRGTLKPAISEDYSRWDRNERYRKEIVILLNKERKPMCVQEVAKIVGCAWVTAKAILSDLALEGKVKFFSNREGYGRLFMINEEWLNAKAAQKELWEADIELKISWFFESERIGGQFQHIFFPNQNKILKYFKKEGKQTEETLEIRKL